MTTTLDALPLPSFVKTSPARIYLVIGDNLEDGDEFNDLGDVTWCQDKQYDTDIEYVRADVVREIVAAELRKAQEAEHAAPHAGVYQGLTDHIVGLIREDRKAQEGREPVAWRVRRSDGEHELFFHEPTAKQRAECFVPHSSAEPLYTSPPPKSDEARDAERYRWLRENAVSYPERPDELELIVPVKFAEAFRDMTDAAIDAALAAQQKGGA